MFAFYKKTQRLFYAWNYMMQRNDIAAVRRGDAAATGSPPVWLNGFGHTV